MQYWGRSPMVKRAPEYIEAGADLIGQGAGLVANAVNIPLQAGIAAPIAAGRYVAESPAGRAVGRGARFVGQEAARQIGTGWNAVTAPIRYAGREIDRTIIQPAADLARTGMDYVGRGVEEIEGMAGRAIGTGAREVGQAVGQTAALGARGMGNAVDWFNRNVRPPPLRPLPQTKEELIPGVAYQTQRGPATWDGEKFVQ